MTEYNDHDPAKQDPLVQTEALEENPVKPNPLKSRGFWLAFGLSAGGYLIFYLLSAFFNSTGAVILALLGLIPYAISGIIAWVVTRGKNRPLALGLLFGCLTPFTIFFILTGGCGMF